MSIAKTIETIERERVSAEAEADVCRAENERLREALHSIAHTAIPDARNLRDIARDALTINREDQT